LNSACILLYNFIIKRFIDIAISCILLILLIPFFIIILVFIIFYNKDFPFFIQRRPGKYLNIFSVLKFKTMNDAKDESGELLPDSLRLTKVGRFIRKTSLDELPQLINVLKGDMSLVGPRPLLVEYLPLYNEHQKRRHEVKPGITGWAQVNGRNAISWHEKFDLDVWYVDHCSFGLDMKILWLTILKVFKREGINQAGQATVEKFNGHN
jgi:undecaprenyl phosphate N,N'-diacetylbacillosamine 1-phosphate transferase